MASAADEPTAPPADCLLEIAGTVQGVGFRPFVARLAARHRVRGWVRNHVRGVTVRMIAPAVVIEGFVAELRANPPPAARIVAVTQRASAEAPALPAAPDEGFAILESEFTAEPTTAVTPDLALCADCRRELTDPRDRRHSYPFINCTNCGPRYSIVEALPYDRARTTMAAFVMCADCRSEFADPADRRFHAQPNACPGCGPQAELQDAGGQTLTTHPAAIAAAADALRCGRIVAVKGIGGFHLMADAADEAVVAELRRRKHREEKPLAVMFPSLEALRAMTEPEDDEVRWLTSAAAPIVLVRKRTDAPIAERVAPGNPRIGALLPYAPLHVLLLAAVGRPVVATSGNLSEEPLCTDDAEARQRLRGIADLFLVHNRPIARPVDDSVVRRGAGGAVVFRRARGFAPTPLRLPVGAGGPLLCVGAHMKSAVAVTAGDSLVLSPHIGDLGNPITQAAFRRSVELLGSLYGGRFERVVCDAHPDYASTRFAESLGLPVVRVQHQLAHILACLLEHGGGPERVLGVAWDGTGYGADGTVWGGEFIVVDRAAQTARRVAHLRPFRLPGGEAAVREPRRSALGVLHELLAGGAGARDTFVRFAAAFGFGAAEGGVLWTLLERGTSAPLTTSAGRLFDAVAALLGVRQRCAFEGQAAMELEFAAAGAPAAAGPWSLPLDRDSGGGALQLDWRPMLAEIVRGAASAERAILAARFHASLAGAIVSTAAVVGEETVVLTGGCFQNVLLLEATAAALRAAGFAVLHHHELPPNDGGVAAGQALGALWGITTVAPGEARRTHLSEHRRSSATKNLKGE